MADDNVEVTGNPVGCAWVILALILAAFLFAGEPDMHDAIIQWMMKQ